MIEWIISRLREPSTYAGFAGLAGAVGVSLPEYNAIAAVAMAIAAAVAVFRQG